MGVGRDPAVCPVPWVEAAAAGVAMAAAAMRHRALKPTKPAEPRFFVKVNNGWSFRVLPGRPDPIRGPFRLGVPLVSGGGSQQRDVAPVGLRTVKVFPRVSALW